MKTIDLIQREALKYERFKCQLTLIAPEEVEQFRSEVEQAYERLPKDLAIIFVDKDPYPDLFNMTRDIQDCNRMDVSSEHNESQLLPGDLNLKFRAVHDYFHYLLQQPFDFKGELNVYKATKFLHKSDIGKRILYSEIVLQAAYCTYFGTFGKQKVIIN